MLTELQSGDPRQIGPYQLLNRLGSGGMGRVYLGRSPGGWLVAVKVISPELADNEDFRTRFTREIAAARRVSGMFTAPVVDACVDGAVPWLATAFVRGPSLQEAVAAGDPLPPESVLDLAAGLAEGLGAIHGAGVVHRDLKPTNVILSADGPRVIDFGISRSAADTGLTRTGLVMGSPGFMSPEQANDGDVSLASDVFSLGAVLVFAATGRAPFGRGNTAAIVYRIVHGQPDLDRIPGPLRVLIGHCLAKDPAGRPTTPEILAEVEQSRADLARLTEADRAAAIPEPDQESAELPHTVTALNTPLAAPASPDAPAPASPDAPGADAAAAADADTADVTPPTAPDPPAPDSPAVPDPPAAPPMPSAQIPRASAGRRRRTWILSGAAAVALAGLVAGLLVWAPWQSMPAPPAGLTAGAATSSSLSFRWSPPGSGPVPDQYLISQDGKVTGSVPAGVTSYQATGLAPDSAYTYRVISAFDGRRSGPSPVLTMRTLTPSLAAATLVGSWSGNYTITSSAGYASALGKGQTMSGDWAFTPACAIGPCPATLNGDINGTTYTVRLMDAGAVYTGSTTTHYTVCDIGNKQYTDTDQLGFRITASKAAIIGHGWGADSWSGVMTMSTPSSQCSAGTLTASFSSAAPTQGSP